MGQIRLLDNNTINQIAAGEVVERPASVIKELVENSIDAKASAIAIEIKDGGITQIRVTDNGMGIEKEQVEIAFLRHSTSKISKAEDLLNIYTLGFRGEALASIASVSRLQMITKTYNDITGKMIEINGGEIVNKADIGCPNGTTIIINNLFYNTPARLKFLKKPQTEAGYISEIISRLALGHPEISFKFINNSNVVLHTPGNNNLKTVVLNAYDKELAKKLIDIEYEEDDYKISGYIAKPEISRSNRNYEHLYINGRYIKSDLVSKAAEEAYKTRIMIGKFPVYIINLSLPPSDFDVNVHPTKLEVRFNNEDKVYQMVLKSISSLLLSQINLIPNVSINEDKNSLKKDKVDRNLIPEPFELKNNIINSNKENLTNQNKNTVNNNYSLTNTNKDTFKDNTKSKVQNNLEENINNNTINTNNKDNTDFSSNKIDTINNKDNNNDLSSNKIDSINSSKDNSFNKQGINQLDNKYEYRTENQVKNNKEITIYEAKEELNLDQKTKKPLEGYKIVGQVFSTYWIIQKDESMYVIDQHAAHEKILYEKFLKNYNESIPMSQILLQPLVLKLTIKQKQILDSNIEIFNKLGFELELFGEDTYLIRSLPVIFDKPENIDFLIEIIDTLEENTINTPIDMKLLKIATISCKAAVKANNKLDIIEARKLIEDLCNLENPFNCPHGRPTIIEISKYELEKKFKRIQ